MATYSLPSTKRFFQVFVTAILLGIIFPGIIHAQNPVAGDLRSTGSTDWGSTSTWQRWSGTAWEAAGVGANNPGQIPSATSNVYIQATHTVTLSADATCNNLMISTGTTSATVGGDGSLALTDYVLSINGKVALYYNTLNPVANITANPTTVVHASPITKTANSNTGRIKFIGNSRTIFAASQWGSGNTSATTTFDIEFALNANQTGIMATAVKAYNWYITSGTLNPSATTSSIVCGNGAANSGNVTISAGATIASAATGTGTNAVITRVSGAGGTLTVDGTLLLTGTAPTFGMSTITMGSSSLVEYSKTSNQTLAAATNGGVAFDTYNDLTLSGSGTKTLAGAITVNKDLAISGTAILADANNQITGNASGTFSVGSGAGYTTTRTATSWFPTNTPLSNYTLDDNSTVTFNAAATLTNSIPSTYGNLVFGSGTKTLPSSFPITVNGDLTLTSGVLNDNGNTITVKGNIASTGTMQGTGKVLLSGGSAAHGMQGNNWNSEIELNDAQGATLTAAFSVGTTTTGTFTLTNGVVSLNNYNFQMSNSNASGFGGGSYSASAMLLQNGTGYFARYISNSVVPDTYVFPIGENTGTTEYSPVTVTVTANTGLSLMGFKIVDSQHPNDVNTTNYASRYWTVATAPANFTYNATFGYTNADVVGSESTFDVFNYDGTTWAYIPATSAANVATYDADAPGFSAGDAFVVKAPVTFSSTVTIDGVGGSAGVYANLTGTTGLFAALNQAVLTSNLTVNVTAAGTIAETGAVALNQVNESGAGAGTYTITIQSGNSTQRVFEGTYTVATTGLVGLIRLNGADRVTFNGGTGTGRRLLFRNLSTGSSATVFHFLNDASSNKINNCTVEGSTTSITMGLIHIGTSALNGTGNDDIIIDNNDVKQAGSNMPGIGISGDGYSATVQNNGAQITNNNIYNIYRTSSTVAAIFINGNNTGWTISGNKIYQEATRSGSISSNNYGIYMSATSSNGMIITGNRIGGAASDGSGTTTYSSTSTVRFSAIYSNGTTTSASNTISDNIIDNISLTSTSGGNSNYPTFSGIFVNGGKYVMDGNYIGSTSGSPSITVTTSSTIAAARAVAAIFTNSAATSGQTISNNHIGGMSLALSSGNLAMNFNGIKVATGTVTVQGNTIGNSSANSFLLSGPGTGANSIYGIAASSGSGAFVSILDNVIQNVTAGNTGTSTSGQAGGISVSGAGNYTVDGNEISNVAANNTSTSATVPSVVGITAIPGGSLAHSVSNNTIYALTNTSTANTVVDGIYFTGNSAVSQVNKNFVYNLRSGTGTSSVINGIYIGASTAAMVSNNRVRLGYDASGAAITNTSVIAGIVKASSTANNSVYYNSVYIGGTGVGSTANNTFAFQKTLTNAADNVRNNIFVNSRSNSGSGGKHYSVYYNDFSLTQDYNLLYAPGTGGVLGYSGTADQANLSAWKSATSLDAHSISADPEFVDATGTTPNLKISTLVATPAESGGVEIAGLTDDFETVGIRTGYPLGLPQGGTAPDLGADEANLIPKDLLAPVIVLGTVSSVNASCGSSQSVTITATVTDATGVATGSLAPTLWWRLSTGTYAGLLPSSVSGSLYTYTLNLTGISPGQTYQYYIAAQDIVSPANIGYSSGSPVHADVSSAPTVLNASPSTFAVASTTPLSGTVNVGTGQTYTSLNANNSTGLFYTLMNSGLNGNLTVNITSDLNESGLYTVLGNIPEYCGTGYSVTIVSSTTAVRTIYQTSGGNPLINLNGCARVTFDGSVSGSGRYLTFASRQNTPTFYFNGNTTNINIKNCTVEGNNQLLNSVGPGVINFAGLLGTGSAIQNIIIDNNIIRNRSDLTSTVTNSPNSLIHAGPSSSTDATSNPVKSNITISNNEMFNFRESAIQIRQNNSGNGIGDNISITGNKIYETITYTTYQYPVWLEGGVNSKGHTISGNLIGGSASPSPNITGTWTNSKSDGEIFAIYCLNGGTTPSNGVVISDNKISNISVTGTGWSNFLGIRVEYGAVTIQNNLIGSLSSSLNSPNITCAGNGGAGVTDNSAVMGIWTQSTDEVLIDNNTIAGVQANNTTNGYIFFDAIAHGANTYFDGYLYSTPGGKATITNNLVTYCRSGSSLSNLGIPSPEGFMGLFCWTNAANNIIRANKINNCGSNAIFNSNVRIHGMFVGLYGSTTAQTGVVENNEISYLFNENPGDNTNSTSRNPILYGLTIANGNWTVDNNTIYLNNGTQGGSVLTDKNTSIRALNDGMLYNQSNCSARYYNNTVYVSGSNTTGAGTANSTYAFLRFPLDYGSLSITAGAPITLRNNIFINDRGGSGNHRALGNYANTNSDAAINWSSTASNYNFLASGSSNMVTLWGNSTSYDLASFKTLSGGDVNTASAITTSGTSSSTQVNPAELFVNVAAGSAADLRINTTPPNAPYPYDFVSNKGTAVSVTQDIDGDARTSTPDLGADEFFICNTPVVSSNTPTNPTCVGGNGSIALSGLTANTTYSVSYDKNATPVAAANYTANASGVLTIGSLSGGSYNNIVISLGAGCSSSAYPSSGSITLTNPVTPSVTANTPTQPTCAGGSNDGAIALSGLANGTTYSLSYNKNGNPVAAANFTSNGSGVVTITGLTGGSYNNFVLTPVGGCASAAYPASGFISLTTPVCGVNTWQGDVIGSATDWFNAGNWSSNAVPNSCSDDAVIPTSPSGGNNFPILTSASASVGNITVQDGASITINSSHTLSVCGNWTGGTATPSNVTGTGSVVLTGSTAQAISGRTAFTTLHVTKTGGSTATIQANSFIDINTAVELQSGTLATGSGTLTFKSTSTTQIAVLDNFTSGYTGTLTGNITAERFYNATGTTNQHYMGSPVSTTLGSFGAGGNSGFVTPSSNCSETNLASGSVYGSVFSYDQSNGASCSLAGWKVEASGTTAAAAKGFSVTKTGSGKVTVSGAPNLNSSYTQAGTNSGWSNTSLQGRPMTAGWVLVSNPYLAYLDFSSQGAPANFTSEVKVWRTTGAFAGTYQDLQAGEMIAPFQAFFVHSNSTGNYPISGAKRTRSTAGSFHALANDQQLNITVANNATGLADMTFVAFNSDATAQFDNDYDAQKIAGTLGRHTLYTVGANNLWMSKNVLNSITATSTVTMGFEPEVSGSYTFSFEGLNSFDPTSYIMLEDRKLNLMYNVRNGDYTFTADSADQWERFVLHFTPKAEITAGDQNCSNLGTIDIAQPGTANWNYTIADNNNNTIASGTLNETSPVHTNAAAGTYTLTLTDNNNYTVVKTVTVNGTSPILAGFSPSAGTVEEGNDITFNSSNTDAVTATWNFGDGATDNSNSTTATHTYTTPGTYTVTLTVTNAGGCSSSMSQTVTVSQKVETGITNLNNKTGINIWSHENRVYIDFSQLAKTDATVNIYNILGQELVNERFARSTIYNKAITNLEAAYVIVRVKNGDAITTKKVFIANGR